MATFRIWATDDIKVPFLEKINRGKMRENGGLFREAGAENSRAKKRGVSPGGRRIRGKQAEDCCVGYTFLRPKISGNARKIATKNHFSEGSGNPHCRVIYYLASRPGICDKFGSSDVIRTLFL